MSSLTLVRHGQADFFAADYDQLTPLGEKQARLLGEYWAAHGMGFDEVYTGPRVRQRRSAEIAGAAVRAAGLAWPEPVEYADLDEFDLHGIFRQIAPEHSRDNAEFAALLEGYRQCAGEHEKLRNFQRMFEPLLLHWQSLPAGGTGFESWPEFHERVERMIRRIVEAPGTGRRVVVFTSGGFIGNVSRWALGAPERSALELAWRLRNASLTEFVFTRNRFTLDYFNAVPHLADSSLWTYR
ncbi:MAG: histidine phosphatase family protein [Planctomycetia bacterium]|nr:histidine phosphatase family protein [Planctomycetia bacterium]